MAPNTCFALLIEFPKSRLCHVSLDFLCHMFGAVHVARTQAHVLLALPRQDRGNEERTLINEVCVCVYNVITYDVPFLAFWLYFAEEEAEIQER